MENKKVTSVDNIEEVELPVYEVPTVVTYSDDALLEALGPAHANDYEIDPFGGSF